MIKKSVMWTTVFVFFALGSVWFMFSANPEEGLARSSDDVVTVAGVEREGMPLTVVTVTDARPLIQESVTSLGGSYRVMPDATPLAKPVVLTWQLAPVADAESVATGLAPAVDDGVVTAGLAVYRFNEDSLMWDVVLPIVNFKAPSSSPIAGGELSVETSTLGIFALGKREMVTVPEFVEVYKDILVDQPSGAVGFVTTVGYSKTSPSPSMAGGGSIIRLPSVGQQGGCGGAVRPGVSEQRSVVTREVMLLVNDVQTRVTLTFFTRWMMGDGCPVDAPFQTSINYGTLPVL